MTLQDQMKQMLDTAPGVALVALGDLSSSLILNWTGKTHVPREVLDLLGEEATKAFALLGKAPGLTADTAALVHFTERESRIFVRCAEGSDDVICAVCEPGADLSPLLVATTDFAHKIAGAS